MGVGWDTSFEVSGFSYGAHEEKVEQNTLRISHYADQFQIFIFYKDLSQYFVRVVFDLEVSVSVRKDKKTKSVEILSYLRKISNKSVADLNFDKAPYDIKMYNFSRRNVEYLDSESIEESLKSQDIDLSN